MDIKRGLEGLRYYRQRAALTQQGLADILHMNRASIIAWEAGQSWPSAAILPKLADVLLCSIDDLYSYHTAEEEDAPCRATAPTCTDGTDVLPA